MMKLNKVLINMVFAVTACCPIAHASSDALTNEDAAQINEESAPQLSAHEVLDEAIDQYFDKRGIIEGQVGKGGKTYYRSTEQISVKPSNPAWVKARQIAFEKALLNAQSMFVFDNFGRIVADTENMVDGDDSSNNREFPEKSVSRSRLEALWDKVVALEDEKLNQLLQDAGIDSSEFDAVAPARRKDLFVDRFIKSSVKKAMGNSSGLIPLQTFEGSDEKGVHAIGVVMLRSDKLQQLASDMAHQREPFLVATKGKPLSEQLNHPDDLLASQFGIRVVFDESGTPLVLSYGQWGFGYSGSNEKRRARQLKTSGEQADTIASEALAVFMNSRLSMEEESVRGEISENYLEEQNGNVTEEDITTIIDMFSKKVKQRASAKLIGSRIVKRWKYTHPYGHQIVGRVRMWSMDGVDSAKEIANFKPKTERSEEEEQSEPDSKTEVKSGISTDEEEEFF